MNYTKTNGKKLRHFKAIKRYPPRVVQGSNVQPILLERIQSRHHKKKRNFGDINDKVWSSIRFTTTYYLQDTSDIGPQNDSILQEIHSHSNDKTFDNIQRSSETKDTGPSTVSCYGMTLLHTKRATLHQCLGQHRICKAYDIMYSTTPTLRMNPFYYLPHFKMSQRLTEDTPEKRYKLPHIPMTKRCRKH